MVSYSSLFLSLILEQLQYEGHALFVVVVNLAVWADIAAIDSLNGTVNTVVRVTVTICAVAFEVAGTTMVLVVPLATNV